MIDPDIRSFIEASERFYPPDAASLPLAEQRRLYEAYARAFAVRRPDTVDSRDATLAVGRPRDPAPALHAFGNARTGLVLYAHGGGFMLGSLDSHDGIVARVAAETGAEVIAIDYRLAPEHPVPAALADVLAVLAAATDGRLPWPDLPRSGLVLMGDSAGATLMASAALAMRTHAAGRLGGLGSRLPRFGLRACRAGPQRGGASPDAHARRRPVLPLASIWPAEHRRPAPSSSTSPTSRAFPPTFLLPAQHDPLRDDCTVWPERLRRSGTDVWLEPGTGLVHGFLRAIDRAPAAAAPFHGFAAPWPGCMAEDPYADAYNRPLGVAQQGALGPNIA